MAADSELISTIYISSARVRNEDEIVEILRVSRKNNEPVNITGLLAYREGNFLQILEGPAAALTSTVERIGRDPRHVGMIVLSKRAVKERLFPDWSMAFRDTSSMSPEDAALCSTLLVDSTLEEKAKVKPDLCYQLLLNFKKNMRYS